VDEGADPLALDEGAREAMGVRRIAQVRLPGARDMADHALAHPEARAHALLVEADRRDGAQVRRGGLVAPQRDPARADELARLLDDRRVDLVELERDAHGPDRLVELALLASAALLALEQLGPLEGQRGEVGEDLHESQLLGAERALRRTGGDREHPERPARGGAHRAGDERRAAIPVPGAPGGLGLELLFEALAQGGRALPLLEVVQEQRLAALDRRLGDARALAIVRAPEDGRHRLARLVAGEPGGGGADQTGLEVDDLERAAAYVEQAPDLSDDLLERVPQPRRRLRHRRDPISTRYA
jgi:hypothetical protein